MSSLSGREKKDISNARGSRKKINPIFYLVGLGLLAIFILYILSAGVFYKGEDQELLRQKRSTHIQQLDADRAYYAEWLEGKLGRGSSESFLSLTSILVDSSGIVPATGDFVSESWIGLHKGLIRAVFLIVAWWKFCALAILIAFMWSMRTWQVYFSKDILGRQTNGRLFYSGIRGDLKKINTFGAPDVLVPGLACPKISTAAAVKVSPLGKILEHYGAANSTNTYLAGILCAYKTWPAFVALRNEYALLEAAYKNTTLTNHAALVLDAALSLRETYCKYKDNIETLNTLGVDPVSEEQMTPEQYISKLKLSFNRVLSSEWKLAITELSAKELAAIVLAHEAGKVMAYTDEGHRFFRTSIFPQLCARSVLHSVPDLDTDFTYSERNTIRRAIIYASRKSVYGPVKFTLDLTPQTRAARQWVELLMACPHELKIVGEEVELYGLICEIHARWSKGFIDDLMVQSADKLKGFITQGTVLYVPLNKLIPYFTNNIESKVLARLAHLVAAVSHRQQLTLAEIATTGIGKIPDYQKIYTPLTTDQISKLSKDHKLDPKIVADWSPLRDVLNYYSWLGRRVGDSTVSDNSIIHLAVRRDTESYGSLEDASECHSGMVALRATRLIDRWGVNWAHKYDQVFSVTSVDNMEEFEKFKRGESLDDIDLNTAETF